MYNSLCLLLMLVGLQPTGRISLSEASGGSHTSRWRRRARRASVYGPRCGSTRRTRERMPTADENRLAGQFEQWLFQPQAEGSHGQQAR